jgi:hypothetical protein
MGQITSVVSRFVRDSKLLKTCQGRRGGRSEASVIAKKASNPRKYPLTGSKLSPLAQHNFLRAKHYEDASRAKDRRTRGNNKHIPDSEKWECTLCKVKVRNCIQSISQHKGGQRHKELIKDMRYCDRCNVYIRNTPEEVIAHETSFQHGFQQRLESEPTNRDGHALAQKQRNLNANAVEFDANPAKKRKPKI